MNKRTAKTHCMKATLVALNLAPSLLAQSGVQPQPIPPGFDFPAKQADLEKLRDNKDVAGMRKHAWQVFAGMTQPAAGGEAIWETWWPSGEVMDPSASPQAVRVVASYPALPLPTWPRSVGVDPSRDVIPSGETATVNRDGKSYPNSRVVPLKSFYHFQVTAEMVDQFRTTAIFGGTAEPGDYLALVNFHFTTREIPEWVWVTLWWHDKPDETPYGDGRIPEVKGAWRNYRMDATFSMDTPVESDGTANAVFNPWLEARFPNGVNSNCMTCHQRAVWPDPGFLPVTRGALKPDNSLFSGTTKADFLWSIILESK